MDENFELDDKMEAIIASVGEVIAAEESKPQMINPPRIMQMHQAYRAVISMAESEWKVKYSLHFPCVSMGTISVEAEDFIFEKLGMLQQVLKDASNIEIYPLTNGKLKMNITFHGITKRM